MENRVSSLEQKMAELKTDMVYIKEMLEMKTKKRPSVVEDHLVNKNDKSSEDEMEGGDTEGEENMASRSWTKKVEVPTFEGNGPLGWLAGAEKFFEVQQIKSSEKLRLAFVSMEGNAVHWF